jgi:DNA-directed RNA polymerase subunit RPC12/RpoP
MKIERWNADKPRRCPACHVIAVDLEVPDSRSIYTCCGCGTRFAKWPVLRRFLRDAGVRCSMHGVRT